MASDLLARHAVYFKAACALSSVLVLVAGIRACAYFWLPKERRLLQLSISAIFLASCASLLGVIASKAYSMQIFLFLPARSDLRRGTRRCRTRAAYLDFRGVRSV